MDNWSYELFTMVFSLVAVSERLLHHKEALLGFLALHQTNT